MSQASNGIYRKYLKRPLDFLCSASALILLSPVMAVTAILVRSKLGTPVIFSQDRPGLGGKTFRLHKFRTMTDARDAEGNLLPDEDRLTEFGRRLRATSLDELPELLNIIKGDMSVVGPRPLLVRYLDRYNEEQMRRHDARPGLTGYAQTHGRNALSWEDKFAMDVWYTQNITFCGDAKIVLDTVKTVIKHEGVNSETAATMEEFMGTPEGVKATWAPPKNKGERK